MRVFTCKTCMTRKLESEFYKHPAMKSGYLSSCKECVKARVTNHRCENIEAIREYDKHRNRGRQKPSTEWRSNNPEKYKAHSAVSYALRSGRLIKPGKCERCSRTYGLHAHHDDYSRQLDVMWLCVPCHHQRHKELKAMSKMEAAE
jgi:predicted alpha/beta-hydrolase family hydrolase